MTGIHLELANLAKDFRQGKRTIRAVRAFSLKVMRGECLALVGESGSGKSTVANMILGIFPPNSGELRFNGEPLPARRMLRHRRMIQLVQQNPLSALNPARTVGASLGLALNVHNIGDRASRRDHVRAMLQEVGLPDDLAARPPSALSGGQRQRVAIARALACQAEFVVLDEPTSSLDVIVQARVLALLRDLQQSRGLTYFFITHDLAVVRNIADRVAVMRAGELVEINSTRRIFSNPLHPYTRRLIAACPVITEAEQALRASLRRGSI